MCMNKPSHLLEGTTITEIWRWCLSNRLILLYRFLSEEYLVIQMEIGSSSETEWMFQEHCCNYDSSRPKELLSSLNRVDVPGAEWRICFSLTKFTSESKTNRKLIS